MAQFDLQLPKFGEGDLDDAKQRRKIMNYLYKLDEQLRFVLNNLDTENFTETFQQVIVGGGGGKGAVDDGSIQRLEAELAKLSTMIRQTADRIEMKANAEELNELGDAVGSVEASLTVLAGKIESKVSRTEFDELGNAVSKNSSTITQTAEEIRAEVKDEIAGVNSTITQTASQIRSEVKNEIKGVNSTISQTASEIRTEVADEVKGLNSTISQTEEKINAKVSDQVKGLTSSFNQTAGEIRQEVSDEVAGLNARITQTASEIRQELSDEAEMLDSRITQTAGSIQSAVTDMANNLQSQINQTPQKIELAVSEVQVGGTQMIRHSKSLPVEAGNQQKWRVSSTTYVQMYDDPNGEEGFRGARCIASGEANDIYATLRSPYIALPNDWYGRQITISAWLYSPNWKNVDLGFSYYINLCPSATEGRFRWGSKRIIEHGTGTLGSDAVANGTPRNQKWIRVSATFTLNEDDIDASGSSAADFASATHMYVGFVLRRNGQVNVYAPKAEWGNKATDWCLHPEEFEAGSTALITKNEVRFTTPEFNVVIPSEDGSDTMMKIDKDGAFFSRLASPNVAPRYDGPDTLYVNPNATSTQVAAGTHFRSLAEVANRALNDKWLDYAVTVNLVGTVGQSEEVTFRGIHSGYWITLKGTDSSHAKLIGKLNLYYNSAPFRVQYLDIDTISSGLVGVELYGRMQNAEISGCIITGRGDAAGAYGINVEGGALARVSGCEVYNLRRSFRAAGGGLLAASGCKGNCSPGTNLANMHLSGTQACSSASTWTDHPSGGEIYKSNVTVNQGSMPSAPEPEAATVSYKANNSDVYAGGGWNNYSAEDIYQGYTTALGEHRGCFWFDNATIRSALNGKTIKQATLTLYQMSGAGRNQPVQVNLEGITATSGTGNSPVGKPEYGVIGTTLGVNQATTFTLPTAVITDLVKGTINGLMLRTGETSVMKNDDNSYNYARFAGKATAANAPVLTVAYT